MVTLPNLIVGTQRAEIAYLEATTCKATSG